MTNGYENRDHFRALLVDSCERGIRSWSEAVIQSEFPMEFDVARSVAVAHEFAQRYVYDVVFLDGQNETDESITGLIEAVNSARERPYFVSVSDGEDLETLRRARSLKMDDFITKGPVYGEEIALHLRSFLERLKLREVIRASERGFRNLFESIPLPVLIVHDTTAEILVSNQEACSLLGMGAAQVEGARLSDYIDEFSPLELWQWKSLLHQRSEIVVDPLPVWGPRLQGGRYRGRIRSFQLGMQQAFQVTIEDVSRLDKEAQSIQYVTKREGELEKMLAVGQILSKVAHEINNPMSVIMGLSLLLSEEEQLSEYRSDLQSLQESAQRCNQLLQDVLRFTRMKEISPQDTNLGVLLQRIVGQWAPVGEGQGIQVTLKLDECEGEVKLDPVQLEHVLISLLNNGREAIIRGAKGGRIMVSTCFEGDEYWIDIANDGPPIPEADWEQIFSPFFTTKPRGEGVGLSLFYCKGVIDEHFGKLEVVRSDPGETVFRIILPASTTGILTHADSIAQAQDTPARRVLVYVPDPLRDQYAGLLDAICLDPFMEVSIARNEDDLLDETAAVQPEYVVFLSADLTDFAMFAEALRMLVVQANVEMIVLGNEERFILPESIRVCEEEAMLVAMLKERKSALA